MIPLKSRQAAEVEAAIRLLYVQIRAEGLPLQRVHSDRARELRGRNIRQVVVATRCLSHHRGSTSTSEQWPSRASGEDAETASQDALADVVAAQIMLGRWQWVTQHGRRRETAMERGPRVVPFGAPVIIRGEGFWCGVENST